MAHNLMSYNGGYAYMGRKSAWHSLGNVTGKFFTAGDVCAPGSMLDYTVSKKQLEYAGVPVEAWGMFRDDNGAFLGPVGREYTDIPHQRGFAGGDHIVGSIEGAHYETAGALGLGETVFACINLNTKIEVVEGDFHGNYMAFITSHNGTRSFEYRLTKVRIVCQNTLNFALSQKTAAKLRVRHTKNANQRLDEMHEALEDIRQSDMDVAEKLRFLATRKVERASVEAIFDKLFPKTAKDDGREESSTRRNNILSEILQRYESNDRNAFPVIRGTAYNLLNAITEYTDHYRSAKGGARAESAVLGSGDTLKTKALEVITLAANGMPAMPAQRFVSAPMAPAQGSILDAILAQ